METRSHQPVSLAAVSKSGDAQRLTDHGEIEECYRRILRVVGENADREGLAATPMRAAQALYDLTSGYREDLDKIINGAIFESESDELIVVRNIETYSLCEHHMLPFIGRCHVAYVPNGTIIGLAKVPRVVNHFARRLQIQERLTTEIAHTLQEILDARGVGVVVEANHLCVMMRGVEKQHSDMKTSCMLGLLRRSATTRSEFLELIH